MVVACRGHYASIPDPFEASEEHETVLLFGDVEFGEGFGPVKERSSLAQTEPFGVVLRWWCIVCALMLIVKRLKGKAIAAWLGAPGAAVRRAAAMVQQRIEHTPKRLAVYLEVSDAWSYLAVQAASRLADAYPVELSVHIVAPPASDVATHLDLRAQHSVRDAALLAAYWNLDFAGKTAPSPEVLRAVNAALLRPRPPREQLRCALELLRAMWSDDQDTLAKRIDEVGTERLEVVALMLAANYEALRNAGHYQGAMLHYRGEWYGGVDRLSYLEEELARDFACDRVHVLEPRSESERGPQLLSTKPLTCELWFSFRSPYSYLAVQKIEEVLRPFDVQLELRPIYPMVMRGIPLPSVKRFYLVRDAKREADRQGIPFGEICDPLGQGIEHLLSLSYWAKQQGKLTAFAKSATRGSWAEARDMTEEVDLRFVVERAGLSWSEAKHALGNNSATVWANAAAAELEQLGLWGVPSFRCGEFVAWGQDRLPLLADRLRRHAAAQKLARD